MTYLGNDLQVAYPTYRNIDDISGSFNGVTTSFALLVGGVAPVPLPLNSQQCLISVAGVVLRPDDTGTEGFRLSGGNIIFQSAPSSGADFFGVILAGADYINVGVNFPSGSAAVPSITFDSDLDTGIYNSAANNISITTGGTQRLVVDSRGRLGLGTSSPGNLLHVESSFSGTLVKIKNNAGSTSADTALEIESSTTAAKTFLVKNAGTERFWVQGNGTAYFNGSVGIGTTSPAQALSVVGNIIADGSAASQYVASSKAGVTSTYLMTDANGGNIQTDGAWPIRFTINSTERARIDSSGRLLVGTSTARSVFDADVGTPRVQQEGASFGSAGLLLFSDDNTSTASNYLAFGRARGGSLGSTTIVNSGDTLGFVSFCGADGTGFNRQAARIDAFVDGTPGSGDMPGRLVFSTTADGASSPTERMRIPNGGGLCIGSTVNPNALTQTSGIRLGGSTIASNDFIDVTTTPVTIANGVGIGGMGFVQAYNTSTGAQYTGIIMWRSGVVAVVSESSALGFALTFSVSGSTLRLQTASGTVTGSIITLAS